MATKTTMIRVISEALTGANALIRPYTLVNTL